MPDVSSLLVILKVFHHCARQHAIEFQGEGTSLLTVATPCSPKHHLCWGTKAAAYRDEGSASSRDGSCSDQMVPAWQSVCVSMVCLHYGKGTRGLCWKWHWRHKPALPRQPAQHRSAETCPLLSTCRTIGRPCCALALLPSPKLFFMEGNSCPYLYSAVLLLIYMWQLNHQVQVNTTLY